MVDYTAAGFTLLQRARLYTPKGRGIYDVPVANGKITAVASSIPSDIIPDCTAVGLSGQIFRLGFISQHVHLTGGGGEADPTTCTSEVVLSRLTETDIASVAGLLGTDSISRHPESLLAKTRALSEKGINIWMLIGACHVPPRIIIGSIEKNVTIVDHVIDAGCAIFDHRSVAPDVYHLTNMAVESCVGDLLGGKLGVTVLYMGDSEKALQPVYDLLENCDMPISKLLSIHISRSVPLFGQALEFARKGDTTDTTNSIDEPVTPAGGITRAAQAGTPLAHITFSSDGNGNQPFFGDRGNLTHIDATGFGILLEIVQMLAKDYNFSISGALRPLTSGVTGSPNLTGKGEILPGSDADLLVMTPELRVGRIYVRDKLVVKDGRAYIKGAFEAAWAAVSRPSGRRMPARAADRVRRNGRLWCGFV